MVTRIRYRKTKKEKVYETGRLYSPKTGAEYIVRVDLNDMTFLVINAKRRQVLRRGGIKDNGGNKKDQEKLLKKKARRALLSLGVELNMEIKL